MIRDDSHSNANLYYLTGFKAPDPFIYLRKDGESIIVVPQLEFSKAKEEAEVDRVISSSAFTPGDSRNNDEKTISIFESLLERFEIEKVSVPSDFELKFADEIRKIGIDISAIEDKVMDSREIKSSNEIDNLRQAQQATEKAMKKAEEMLESSAVKDGKLYLNGNILTSERIKREIGIFLFENGCEVPDETIVASGPDSAKPHSRGSGPIKPREPIVIDIFPRHKNRYFGDMTRSFVKGKPSTELKEMKEAVLEAQKAALEVLEKGAGVNTTEVHNKVCDVFEKNGYDTLRDNTAESGFIHSTDHAVGLDLHEPPRIADNETELKSGHVLTIEPGLYLPEIGGVRIEDMVLITENGYENFNSMHKELEID
jgi:Xaa-Pro aminopeptidase